MFEPTSPAYRQQHPIEVLGNMGQVKKNKDILKTTELSDKTIESPNKYIERIQETPKKDSILPNEVIELSPNDKLQIEKMKNLFKFSIHLGIPFIKGSILIFMS